MKTILILLLFPALCFAQKDNNKPRNGVQTAFSLEAGIAIPVGSFAATKNNAAAGFAEPGIDIQVSCRAFNFIKSLPDLGIVVFPGLNFNGFNINAWNNEVGTYSYHIKSSSPYCNIRIFSGLGYSHEIRRLTFLIRTTAGLIVYDTPNQITYTPPPYPYFTTTINGPTYEGFGYDIGTGVSFLKRNRIHFFLNVDFYQTYFGFSNESEIVVTLGVGF